MRFRGFDLNQLVCLEALLSERNVTRAAERVYLSQSAMSTVLAQLRRHFGDELLVRTGRTSVLTPFARTLVAPLNDLILRAQVVTSMRLDEDPGTVERELTIVASDYAMTTCLSDALLQASKEMPNLRLDVLPLSASSSQMLSTGEIDLMLAGQAFDVGHLPNDKLFEDEFVCLACRRKGPSRKNLSREEFLARRHVIVRYFEYQMPIDDEELLRREGLLRQRQIAVWSYSLVPQLVCGTTLLATVPSRMGARLSQRWPVKLLPFPFDHSPVAVFAYWHPSRDGDPVLNRFMEIVRGVVAN